MVEYLPVTLETCTPFQHAHKHINTHVHAHTVLLNNYSWKSETHLQEALKRGW